MPLINVRTTASVAALLPTSGAAEQVAEIVLDGLGLPRTDFFTAATWVCFEADSDTRTGSGLSGQPIGAVVELIVLAGITDADRNRSMSAALTERLRDWSGDQTLTVWFIVNEVPEGAWGMNGALTELAAIRTLAGPALSQA